MGPLFGELIIEQFGQIYSKHKFFGLRKFLNNNFTNDIFYFLKGFYNNKESPNESFINQLKKALAETSSTLEDININETLKKIDCLYKNEDVDVRKVIKLILDNYKHQNSYYYLNLINDILRVDF